jgi:Zn-dependent metalloprotease
MRVSRTPDGYVRAVGAPAGRAWPVSAAAPEASAAARAFMRENQALFGLARGDTELVAQSVRESRGRSFVRLEQRRSGLKVFGAGVVVQVEPSGGVSFVLADVARDGAAFHGDGFSTEPDVGESLAGAAALDLVGEVRGAVDVAAGPAELAIFEPSVIGMSGGSRLVWNLRVTNEAGTVNEVVLVDAASGEVAFHYSEIMEGRDRQIYDSNNVYDSLGTLVRSEGDPVSGNADVDIAYDYLGDTYDYYDSNFGRDSFDDMGASLIARVRYCETGFACPYANAYWNGSEMRFGEGYASADDVVAHELTHAVTTNESNLIYWGESGAINEALSDIFGELIDLTNSAGDDSSGVRWLLGEDLPAPYTGVGIRSMSNPPAFGDPDRRFSPLWHTGNEDNRGVHINSGVANKLAFLLADGGSFNGKTVTGLGLDAVGDVFYEAQVNLLLPATDYYDLDVALVQAAVNLSWSLAAHDSLREALQAVEISGGPSYTDVFTDGFDSTLDSWAVSDDGGAGATWGLSTYRKTTGASSLYCAGGGTSPPTPGTTYLSNMDAWAVYGPFSLEEAEQAWAEFDVYIDVDYPYDDVFWGVSVDGTVFDGYAVSPYPYGCTITCSPSTWVHEFFNLEEPHIFDPDNVPSVIGATQVWFAFNFRSDEIQEWEGVYVDDFAIRTRSGPATPTLVNRYRLYSDITKEHHYTTDLNEYNTLGTWGWVQEGVAHQVYLTNDPVFGQVPVPLYRLYHEGIQQHHWTTDANENAVLPSYGWTQEGIDGYILASEVSGVTTPLYRLAYAFLPLHLWTTDLNEYTVLATMGWIQEGIAGHVVP